MATSVIPAVIDYLVTHATTALSASSVIVYDGFGTSDEPGDFLMIGVDDPESVNTAFSADSVQQWAHANYTARDEEGDVTCAALSWNGDCDQKAARDAVFAITAALENLLRADPTLAGAVLWSSYGTSTQLTQNQSNDGAMSLVVFKVHFRARI